ncbi:amidoligase family protein [Bdellovibrio sp. HCB2-146]|uniref:amidoligase family protein n=1 Tax=Bdellovibrio sp. HCB2-146 TaxID=3394362 RepID=UPI0039BD2BD1
MKTSYFKTGVLLFLATTSISFAAQAQDFLQSAGTMFFSPIEGQRYGIEVELMGLSQRQVVDIMARHFGGTEVQVDSKNIRLTNSKLGKALDIKIEVNETSDDPTIDWSKHSKGIVIEIVTDPITFEEVKLLDQGLAEVKKAGGIGTEGKNPISIQVNYGMVQKQTADQQAKDLVNILRNYFNPAHQQQIKAVSNVPAERWDYLKPYSDGFMKKIFDPKYNPTAHELFVDFFYRQALEFLSESPSQKRAAWLMSEAEVRHRIATLPEVDSQGKPLGPYKVHTTIIKLNQLKIASLLLTWFPEDPYTRKIVDHKWIKPAPLIEYRIANNDFDVESKVRWATGIYRMSKTYGAIDHDTFMSRATGKSVQEVRAARKGKMCEHAFFF